MFIPLHDANSLKHIRLQYVTLGMIAANVIVFLITALGGEATTQAAALSLGYIPSVVFDHAELPAQYVLIPENATYVTYAFLHADLWHIGGNMLFLWVFGDNVEDAMGHVRFFLFFLICAAAGALFHGMVDTQSQAPLIGASGAVAGVLGAYAVLYPFARVFVLARIVWLVPLPLPAIWMLGAWFATQLFYAFAGSNEPVAWWAHIGGVVAGAVLVLLLKRREVPLFGGR